MTREIAPFGVRMPPDLKGLIEAAANTNGRSMNAEIVGRLQQSFASASSPLAWGDLVDLLQSEAEKRGAKVTVTVTVG
jgi:hypothetical protein